MADRKLKIDIRRGKILELLRRDGKVNVARLSRELGATAVTIRSDLSALERDGYLLRVQGGAVVKPRQEERMDVLRQDRQMEEKHVIASVVSELIRDGDTLFINSGSTSLAAAQTLRNRKNLNIVTNSVEVATCLSGVPTLRVLLLGGVINSSYGFTCGGDAQEQLERYQAEWALLSVDGISAGGGVTTYHAEEAVLDRMMISGAKHAIVMADNTKIGRTGFSRVCECSDRLCLVTDRKAPREALEALKTCGVKVITP